MQYLHGTGILFAFWPIDEMAASLLFWLLGLVHFLPKWVITLEDLILKLDLAFLPLCTIYFCSLIWCAYWQSCRYTKYTITSLEKMYKPKLFVEPDLGIPLDLLDISVYKYEYTSFLFSTLWELTPCHLWYHKLCSFSPPSVKPRLAPEDEELLRDAELTTPVKQDGIRRKERPTDKGVSWLVKTQYISPLSMDAAKMVRNICQFKFTVGRKWP